MNKKLVALVAAAMMSISAGSVFAAENPVTFDSSLSVQYRSDKQDGTADTSDTKTTFVTNASFGLAKNVSFYGRIAAQHLNNGNFSDFAAPYASDKDALAFDQYGIIIKGGDNNFTYKIGRQSIGLGANETLYSSSGYYGTYTQADGITITGKSGIVDLKAIAAKEDTKPSIGGKNKIYGLEASYKPSDAWTLGATLARYDYVAFDRNFNTYAVNVGYNFSPKANIMTEYAKSNYDNDNKAYNAVFNYAFDNKLTGSLTYSRTEAYSTPNTSEEWTAFDLGYKGFYYGLDYKVAKDYTLSVLYKDLKDISSDNSKKSLRTTLTYKF